LKSRVPSRESAGPFVVPPAHCGYDRLKRALDVTIAVLALFCLSPLWLAIAVAIKLTSQGPVLFSRTVIGRAGTPFVYYKFRTMRHDNNDDTHRAFIEAYVKEDRPFMLTTDERTGKQSAVFKVVDDPRVTRIGRLLRKMSLDEIPQLLNVLRGEMSIVGPRQPIEFEFRLYDAAMKARLAVLPGITGWAQVRGRGNISFTEMCRFDIEYIRNRSILLDIRILAATFGAMTEGS
jgi:lipopolysaccharide/colanic/teichoic acid biosynthesis glycosyltransferase